MQWHILLQLVKVFIGKNRCKFFYNGLIPIRWETARFGELQDQAPAVRRDTVRQP